MFTRFGFRELICDHPLCQDHKPITHGKQLGELRGDHDNRDPSCDQFQHELIDLVLGADINAFRRLVHQQDPGIGHEHFGQDHLLLVTTA